MRDEEGESFELEPITYSADLQKVVRRVMNKGMILEDFQFIYWWEWGHRQLGRAIGLVWEVGFLGFLIARNIHAGWSGRLLGLVALGWAKLALRAFG